MAPTREIAGAVEKVRWRQFVIGALYNTNKSFWAKALYIIILTNPGLKSGVSNSHFEKDFSPKIISK